MVGERHRDPARPDPGEITAVILAGGMGTRLRSVLPDRQKVLAPVSGRPFLTFLLDKLQKFGIRNVVLCAGYLAKDVVEQFAGQRGTMNIEISCEPSALGTAGALRHALPRIKTDHLLVMNGDSYCSAELDDLHAAHFRRDSDATIALVRVDDAGAYGSVNTDSEERITKFEEKSNGGRPGWVNAGVYLLRRGLIETIPAGRPVSIEKEMFPLWTERALFGYKSDGVLLDIGTPERYAAAAEFFATQAQEDKRGASIGY